MAEHMFQFQTHNYSRRKEMLVQDWDNGTIPLVNITADIEHVLKHEADIDENLDQLYFVFNGLLVIAMQTGFACIEAGAVHSKNVTNIMLKNYLDTLICSIVFWVCGYGIAFGRGNGFLGLQWFFGIDMPDVLWGDWFYQFSFASTASTVLSGALAERCSFAAYLFYSSIMSGIIYPFVVHWAWAKDGWLKNIEFYDFSGSLLVHGVAGAASLMGTIIIGPRIGRFDKANELFTGHSTALTGIGGLLLLFGFNGFNAGTLSHFSHHDDGIIFVRIVRNTLMSAAASSLTVLFSGRIGVLGEPFWPFDLTINAGVAGLVVICAGCAEFTVTETIVTGIIAGIIYMLGRSILIRCKVDDPLDSSPIHMGCGIWGVLSIPLVHHGGFFGRPASEVLQKLFIQMIGVASIIIWAFCTSTLLFFILKVFHLFRASKAEEILGMDLSKHNQSAYPAEVNNSIELTIQRPRGIQAPAENGTRPNMSVLCSTASR